jgi:hypothetical protein
MASVAYHSAQGAVWVQHPRHWPRAAKRTFGRRGFAAFETQPFGKLKVFACLAHCVKSTGRVSSYLMKLSRPSAFAAS